MPTYAGTPDGDTITGDQAGVAPDHIFGLDGDDFLFGVGDADLLEGGNGLDMLSGGDGADALSGGAGNDTLDGGAGVDTASYAGGAAGVVLSLATTLAQNTGGGGIDTLTAIEALIGSAFADILTGSVGNNRIDGGSGRRCGHADRRRGE